MNTQFQQRAKKSEINFFDFCKQKEIVCVALDDPKNQFQRQKFLIKPGGKCPDFWCRKNNQEIFVEVKTLTNFTNTKREKQINEAIRNGLKNHQNIIRTSEVFNPIPELRGPFETFLRDTSSKFKNIKDNYNFPKILLLNNVINIRFACYSIFFGEYDSYSKVEGKLTYVGMRKKERGLFDKTGSSVSALVFWNEETERFEGSANFNVKIEFIEDNFKLFFGV